MNHKHSLQPPRRLEALRRGWQSHTLRLAVLGAVATTGLLIGAFASAGAHAGLLALVTGNAPAGTSLHAAQSPGVEFDQQFIDMMVPHHEGAVEMARIAQQRSQRAEILALAVNILASQESEIHQMRAWRQAWYGSEQTPPMSQMPMLHDGPAGQPAMAMNMADEVGLLRNAPEPFDRAFIDAMIPHHQSAIDAARLAEQRAARQEIRDLARAIITEQQREIDALHAWRQAWFGAASAPQTPHMPGMSH